MVCGMGPINGRSYVGHRLTGREEHMGWTVIQGSLPKEMNHKIRT